MMQLPIELIAEPGCEEARTQHNESGWRLFDSGARHRLGGLLGLFLEINSGHWLPLP